jgi:hypothetical protein
VKNTEVDLPKVEKNGGQYINTKSVNSYFKECRIGAFEIYIVKYSKIMKIVHSKLNTKKSLIKNIEGLRNDNYLNYINLNLELFNAKSYEIYLENKEYFKNINSFYHYTNEKYL